MTSAATPQAVPAPRPVPDGDLAAVVLRQAREVCALKEQFFASQAARIVACAQAMARAFDAGGKLLVFGNGGSASDALHMAVECMHPIIEKRPPLPAIALTTDTAILTAIGNDQDFALAFVQQLKLLGRSGDVALGFSTSGKSANVARALQAAREMRMLTIGCAGRDGGRMPKHCDHCFIVPSFSIPRIQETHETLLHVLWDLVHVVRGEEDVL